MDSANELLKQATSNEDHWRRRQAFCELIQSADWRRGLAAEVIAQQGYKLRGGMLPDLTVARMVAPVIASSEEKVQRALEILGSEARFSLDLLAALAQHMGPALVEHALAHLRTANGDRAAMLVKVLFEADPGWVRLRAARRVIRRQLEAGGQGRIQLMSQLATAGQLARFLETVKEDPPRFLEEWGALGRAGVWDESLINRALAFFRGGPEPLAYLLRLDPVPGRLALTMMAAARPDWMVEALEVAIIEQLDHPLIIPLAELGVRLGGRPMAAVMAWLNSARLTRRILNTLAQCIQREESQDRLDDLMWIRRHAPSADRAMEHGRRGDAPHPMDAAALVRQLRGSEVPRLVMEILSHPLPALMDSVLRPLCTVSLQGALEVRRLASASDPALAARAQQALSWPDVIWEEEEDLTPPPVEI